MQNRNDISKELLEISRLVAEIDSKKNLYEVPVNYFESLADAVILRIKNAGESAEKEIAALSVVISGIDKGKATYRIPENYFESFAEKMLSIVKAEQATDASEELAMLSPLLSKADKKNPYTAPEGFFNELPSNLVAGMKAVSFVQDELEAISPVIAGLKNKSTYTAPEGYFDHLSETILSKIKTQSPAKVISLKKNRSWMRYAVAAAVTGIIFTVGVLTFNNNASSVDEATAGLSKISDQEMNNYLDNHTNALEAASDNSTATADFNENDVTDLLGSVPDNELEDYVTVHSGAKTITN